VKIITTMAAAVTLGVILLIVLYILVKGVPHIKLDLFELTYTTENVSLMPALINTLIAVVLALIVAAPIGIFSAIYLAEYAKKTNKVVGVIRLTSETLSGVPSIVYGLFGLLFFVTTLGLGFSILAGTLTLAIMILPLIMRTTEEALNSVPDTYREASFGLGAGRLRTVFKIVLPAARPGILAGIILAIGRIVGESAALLYTAGSVAQIPSSLTSSGRTLSVHMYALSSEGLYTNEAYATAVILLVFVLAVNGLSNLAARKLR
jgi:phosphate transport system permease protein